MSNHNSSLALEDIHEYERVDNELQNLLLQARHLSISSVSVEPQLLYPVVKVTGNITISF